jgi:hypothetical protein
MYNIAKAAEAGMTGNPDRYRDYELPKPGHPESRPAPVGADSSAIPRQRASSAASAMPQ